MNKIMDIDDFMKMVENETKTIPEIIIKTKIEYNEKLKLILSRFDPYDGIIIMLLLKLPLNEISEVIKNHKDGYGYMDLLQDILNRCGYKINVFGDSGLGEVNDFLQKHKKQPLCKKNQAILSKLYKEAKTKVKNDYVEKKIFTLSELSALETHLNKYWQKRLDDLFNSVLSDMKDKKLILNEEYKIINEGYQKYQKLPKTPSAEVYTTIINRIKNPRPTLKDLASKSKISTSTWSSYLSNKYTLAEIMNNIIKESGYRKTKTKSKKEFWENAKEYIAELAEKNNKRDALNRKTVAYNDSRKYKNISNDNDEE